MYNVFKSTICNCGKIYTIAKLMYNGIQINKNAENQIVIKR